MSDKESKGEIDIKKVKELIALMKENDLAELEVVCGHDKIVLKRPQPMQPAMAAAAMPASGPAPAQGVAGGAAAQPAIAAGLVEITSPMVGTFYAAPAPDAEAYVAIGSKVALDTVVCIVEAMKVMNEIKAETAGTIVEVHCEAGQAVEYGQPLFRVRPD